MYGGSALRFPPFGNPLQYLLPHLLWNTQLHIPINDDLALWSLVSRSEELLRNGGNGLWEENEEDLLDSDSGWVFHHFDQFHQTLLDLFQGSHLQSVPPRYLPKPNIPAFNNHVIHFPLYNGLQFQIALQNQSLFIGNLVFHLLCAHQVGFVAGERLPTQIRRWAHHEGGKLFQLLWTIDVQLPF